MRIEPPPLAAGLKEGCVGGILGVMGAERSPYSSSIADDDDGAGGGMLGTLDDEGMEMGVTGGGGAPAGGVDGGGMAGLAPGRGVLPELEGGGGGT